MITLQIKELNVTNALCFEKLYVNFEENKVTQIIGDNGVGKSSIPTLLEECLYNKNSRGLSKGDLVNRYTDANYYILSCSFQKGAEQYRVVKEVKSSAKVTLTCNGEDISGHTATQSYKKIQEIIGLDFTTFTKLIYQSMESSLDFLKATDANRKKFFMSLFNLSEYSETEEKLKAAHSSTKKELDSTKTKMDTIRSWLDAESNKEYIKQERREVAPLDISGLQDTVSSVKADIKNIDVNNKLAQDEISKRQHLERIRRINTAPCHDNSEALQKATRDYESISKSLVEEKTKLRMQQAATEKLRNVDTQCPTCGAQLDVEDMTPLILDAEALEEELVSKISLLTRDSVNTADAVRQEQLEQKAYRDYIKFKTDLKLAEEAVDISKPTEIQDASELQEELKKLQLEIQMRQDDFDQDTKHNQLVDINNAKYEQHQKQLAEYQVELEIHSSKLTQIAEIESDLKILKESFSGKGLVNFKIESLIKSFENEINNNLIKLTEGQFALGFTIEDSKLKLKIYSHSEEVSIKSLSTGEFNKVNMSSLLAVRNMMAKMSDVSINVLFLDEVISVLSPNSLETLIEHLLSENLNTFIVSHGYSHPLAEEIHLIKENNISRIHNEY